MISLEKWLILRPLQKLPKNGEDLGNLIAAQGFKKLSKVQYIAQSGHTGYQRILHIEKPVRTNHWSNLLVNICNGKGIQLGEGGAQHFYIFFIRTSYN